jgi:hypothetical protein
VLLADKVALLSDGTITHRHALQLLASVPQYRLAGRRRQLDDRTERSCAWEDDEAGSGSAGV